MDIMENESQSIEGLGKLDKLSVQKSQPMYSLWRSDLTLAEFKILDVYLGRINSHDPTKRTVVFKRKELVELMGVGELKNDDLKMRTLHLMANVVTLEDKDYKDGWKLITLFETASYEKDDSGEWVLSLKCTNDAMKYIFNIENLRYFRYKLRSVIKLDSRYSYILFLYLENHRYLGRKWEESVEELKEILGCNKENNAKSYSQFRVFNDRILKKSQKEILKKTETRFEYETIKSGRNVVAIRFILEPSMDEIEDTSINTSYSDGSGENEIVEMEGQMTVLDYFKSNESQEEPEDDLALIKSIFKDENPAFTDEQVKNLFELVNQVPGSELQYGKELGWNFQVYHYLSRRYNDMNSGTKKIKNRFSYFKKMILNDTKENPEATVQEASDPYWERNGELYKQLINKK